MDRIYYLQRYIFLQSLRTSTTRCVQVADARAGDGQPFWSVNAEEQFYLLAPLLLVLTHRNLGQSSITWLRIAAAAWYSQIYASIIFGVLAATVVYNYGAFQDSLWIRAGLLGVVLVSFGGMLAGYDYESLVPFCSVAIVLLLAVKGQQGFVGSLVGGMSYQLYLNHWIATFVARGLIKRFAPHHEYLSRFISVLLGIFIATAMYWMIDRRLHVLRGRWFTKRRGIAVVIVGYGMCVVGCAYHFAIASNRHYESPLGISKSAGRTKSDIPSPSMHTMNYRSLNARLIESPARAIRRPSQTQPDDGLAFPKKAILDTVRRAKNCVTMRSRAAWVSKESHFDGTTYSQSGYRACRGRPYSRNRTDRLGFDPPDFREYQHDGRAAAYQLRRASVAECPDDEYRLVGRQSSIDG